MPDLFSHMPRVQVEYQDRNLRFDPEFRGKRVAVLGMIDVDGYGYSSPDDPTLANFVSPGTVLRFNEPTAVTDLTQFLRMYRVNPYVGEIDEISPAIAEVQEQGASNIVFLRLDLTFIADSLGVVRPIQQSTGQVPVEWATAMGFVQAAEGTWSAPVDAELDPATTYIPSAVYRSFVAERLGVAGFTPTAAQAHKDPTDADARYWALGLALDSLIGESAGSVVFAMPPGFVNAARALDTVGAYPLRAANVLTPSQAVAVRDKSAPTINNPWLGKMILDPQTLAFKSFDAIGFDQVTISLGTTTPTTGDAVIIGAGRSTLKVEVVATANDENLDLGKVHLAGLTAAQQADKLAQAITGVSNGKVCTASVTNSVVTLTSLVPGSTGLLGIWKIGSWTGFTFPTTAKATAAISLVSYAAFEADTSTIAVTIGGAARSVACKAAQDSANGAFAKGASNAEAATNIAAAFNGKYATYLTATVFKTTVVLLSSVAGGTQDFTVCSSSTAAAATIADGTAGATRSLQALSHPDAGERNFAHLLANFCFWQSYYECPCKGFIGTDLIDTDMDGVVTNATLRAAIGQERYAPLQYIDNAAGAILADNGTGLLGFVNCAGFDGIHRYLSNPDFPPTYRFWATVLGFEMIQRNAQSAVMMFSPGLGDAFIEDSGKGELMDMGARLRVLALDVYLTNAVSGRFGEARGAYLSNAASSAAGFDAINIQGESLTKKMLRNVTPLRRLSQAQMDSLQKCRFIALQIIPGVNRAEVQADDTGAFNIDIFHRSDFVMGLSLDVLDLCIDDVRRICRPALGHGMNAARLAHLSTEIEVALTERIKAGHIQNFDFNFLSTPMMQVLGEAEFNLMIVPSFEMRKIKVKAGLSMPKRALVAAASA